MQLDPNWAQAETETIVQRVDQQSWTLPQMFFWTDPSRQRLFCGGVGAGKTFAGAIEVINQPAGSLGIAVSPTYTMLKDTTLRTFLELYEHSGMIQSFNRTDMSMTLKGNRTILWRSADKPEKLRGINAGWAWMDEAAFCEEEAYSVILGRLRRRPGRVWLTTTPNGKANWVYRLVQSGNVSVTRAPTQSNTFNPDFYVQTMLASYDPKRAAQEIEGEFIDTDGALMKRQWFRPWESELPERLLVCRAWDSAATESGGDYTVGMLVANVIGTDKMIILDVTRGQYGADTVDAMIRTAADEDGKKVSVVLEQEPGSAGKRLLAQQLKALEGHRVNWYSSGSRKLARAVPVARAAAQGRMYYLPDRPWVEPLMAELESFTGTPADEHDDQVDALSLAYSHLEGNLRRVAVY
jgi:predicted phage terminase large subunit-like protein